MINKEVLLRIWRLSDFACGRAGSPDDQFAVEPMEGNYRWSLVGQSFLLVCDDENLPTMDKARKDAIEHATAMGLNIARELEFEDDDDPKRLAIAKRNAEAENEFFYKTS